MRFSTFNMGAPLDGQRAYVLVHGYTGALDKVPAPLGEALVGRRGQPCDEAFLSQWPVETIEQLKNRGYLTELTAIDEKATLVDIAKAIHSADLSLSPSNFMLIPTYRCNLRCAYCFQSHDMHAGKGDFGRIMTREQVDWSLSAMDRLRDRGAVPRSVGMLGSRDPVVPFAGPRRVSLFGGEPLASVTRDIVTYILEQVRDRGDSLSAVTNGVELELFSDLLGPGLLEDLQITLDGPERLHDKRRVGPGYTTTFQKIADNVELALERNVQVALRLNIDTDNPEALVELDGFFRDRGWNRHPKFMAYAAVVQDTAPKDERLNVWTRTEQGDVIRVLPHPYKKQTMTQADLTHKTLQLKRDGGGCIGGYDRYARDLLKKCLAGDPFPFTQVAHCSAETGLLIFDPLGDVYACWEEAGQRERRIAEFSADGLRFDQDMASSWYNRFPGAIDQCTECPYALVHTSGCAKHAREAHGDMLASACESFQEYFPATLAMVYQEFERVLLEPSTSNV